LEIRCERIPHFPDGNRFRRISKLNLERPLGNDFFGEVVGVWLHNSQVSDVSALAKLTKLERLFLNNTQVSDLTPLAKLTKLELLYLRDTPVSDQAIEQLKRALPQCRIKD